MYIYVCADISKIARAHIITEFSVKLAVIDLIDTCLFHERKK